MENGARKKNLKKGTARKKSETTRRTQRKMRVR